MASKFDEVFESCEKQLTETATERKVAVDVDLLKKIAKGLGPSIYNKDSLLVAVSQKDEMDGIRKNFLAKKLGCDDAAAQDKAIAEATENIGKSNRNKLRPVFYYYLVKSLGKESVYA